MTSARILGEKYVVDGAPADVSGFLPDMSAEIYYEVVRLIGGKFLFLGDHLDRLAHSVEGSDIQFPGKEVIHENLRILQLRNRYQVGNIRICLQKKGSGATALICYFVPYFYPEPCMYQSGVQLLTFPHVRPNPGIKKWDDRFRNAVNQFIRDTGVYEAILLNRRNEVTEGSRSNLFFINHREQLVSAPEEEILPGITRKYVMEICRSNQIEIIHRPVPLEELSDFASCFISGTSPKVLPVWQLNRTEFKVDHPVMKFLMDRFELVIQDHLENLQQ